MLSNVPLSLTLGQVPQFVLAALIVLFVVISLIMILVVLIQKPQGGGLSGAFGAAADGAGQTAFGAKTGDVLTFVTIAVFILFLVVAGALNLMIVPPTPGAGTNVTANGGAGTTTPAGGTSGTAVDLSLDDEGNLTGTTTTDDDEGDGAGESDPADEEDYVPLSDQPEPDEPEPGDGGEPGDGSETETPGEGEPQ